MMFQMHTSLSKCSSFSLRIFSVIILIATLSISSSLPAAVFCVNTTEQLQDALLVAAGNTESDEIRITVGTYLVPTTPFPGYEYTSTQIGDITISGGWGPPVPISAPALCESRKENPSLTVLDGQQQVQVMLIRPQALAGNVRVENLWIKSGVSIGLGGGLSVFPIGSSWAGSLNVNSMIFSNNQAQSGGGGLYASVTVGVVEVKNSVFFDNSAGGMSAGANILANGIIGIVANNTVVNNTASSQGAGLRIGGEAPIRVFNNVSFNNTGVDVQFVGNSIELVNNFFNLRNGFTPLQEMGTLSGNPQIGGGSLGLTPLPGSPLIDYGAAVPGALPLFDVDGNQRTVGPAVDAGAFETQLFADSMEGVGEWIMEPLDL